MRYDLRLKLTASPKTRASVFETIKHNHVNVREAYRNEILSNKTISRTRTFFLREKLGISSVCTSQMIVTHFVPEYRVNTPCTASYDGTPPSSFSRRGRELFSAGPRAPVGAVLRQYLASRSCCDWDRLRHSWTWGLCRRLRLC